MEAINVAAYRRGQSESLAEAIRKLEERLTKQKAETPKAEAARDEEATAG